jgi:glycosyltransferase involved in cell wall biosynthesis
LSKETMQKKHRLLDLYRSGDKRERIKEYPAYRSPLEPLVISSEVDLRHVEAAGGASYRRLIGPRALAVKPPKKTCRVAVICDSADWAHGIIARHLAVCAPAEYDIDILSLYNRDYTRKTLVSFDHEPYDVVHLMSWKDWSAISGLDIPKSKLVTTIHGHRSIARDRYRYLRGVAANFTAVSAVSPRLVAALRPLYPGVRYTPCGVDTQRFYPAALAPDGAFTYCAVGRLYTDGASGGAPDDIKGWRRVLLPVSKAALPLKARYLIVDRAPETRFDGMPGFYRGCHVYLCASASEGNPLPLLEAAACGLAVVSTDVGVAPEIVEGGAGRLVCREPEDFVDALFFYADNLEACRQAGRRARARVLSTRDWAFTAPAWAELYARVWR